MRAELPILKELGGGAWLDRFSQLFVSLVPELADGRAMLLRVGRHSGAESVALERHRWFRIMGRRGEQPHWAREATTLWLAGERENGATDLRPFGWLLVEPGDSPIGDHLRRWCEAEIANAVVPSGPRSAPAPEPSGPSKAVWERARLQYNKRNGTLTAIGPTNARANAFDAKAQELLSRLSDNLRRRLNTNQFVQVVARVRGPDLVDIEVRS